MKKVFEMKNFVKNDDFCDKDNNVFSVERDEKRWFREFKLPELGVPM